MYLFSAMANIYTYEMVFGGWNNSKSVIRTAIQGEVKQERATPDLLQCTSFQFLWISWKDGQYRQHSLYNLDLLFVVNLFYLSLANVMVNANLD